MRAPTSDQTVAPTRSRPTRDSSSRTFSRSDWRRARPPIERLLFLGHYLLSGLNSILPVLVPVPPDLVPELVVSSQDRLVVPTKKQGPLDDLSLLVLLLHPLNLVAVGEVSNPTAVRSALRTRRQVHRACRRSRPSAWKCRPVLLELLSTDPVLALLDDDRDDPVVLFQPAETPHEGMVVAPVVPELPPRGHGS